MATYKRFEDLPIWKEARSFSKKVFDVTKNGVFSRELYRAYDYGYIEQIDLEELVIQSENISKSISNFIEYLKSSELKGLKYKTT
ncbi:MAG: hypothetical protein IJL44_04145 [Bacteroidales bacterium]|nr:hypothetical protein [Bacteroidales bacterium]